MSAHACQARRGSYRTPIWLLLAWFLPGAAEGIAEDPPAAATPDAERVIWHEDLPSAYRDALVRRRPILARAESESCPWCKRLEAELGQPAVQAELRRWTLVTIDVDRRPPDLRALGIGSIPALRVLSPGGRLLKSHDGFLPADELVEWLREALAGATEAPDELLLAEGEPSLIDVLRLVRQFDHRDAAVREAAIRRLVPVPRLAASRVVKSFQEGGLSARLTAYEILRQWRAPIERFDPWRDETFAPEHLATLDQWLKELDPDAAPRAPEMLTEDQWRELRTDIDRMLRADEAEAAAIRERIAWYGRAALPGVVALLADAATDMDRQRLLTLRYRLVAGGSLTLTWPGGLQRLADPDQRIRHQAAEELASNAGEESQELLLELFSDPDPFVRELSLRGLRNVGGPRATSALVSLLGDPEPNVRAAVLKQLSEDAPVEMLDAIADYASREQDVDLVVHAVRYLRAVRSNRVISSLLRLLEHDAWQVRAEAAEAIGAFMAEARHRQELASGDEIADTYDALLVRLDDPDAFVVSRVLTALANVDTERAVEPLVRAAASHPDLAPSVLAILARGTHMRGKAIPHLRAILSSDDATLRAAAVKSLCQADPEEARDVLVDAIRDSSTEVRTAAAQSLMAILDLAHPSERDMDSPFGFGDPRGLMQSGLSFEALEVLSRSGRSGLITPLIEGAVRAILPTHSDTSTEPAPDVPPDADEQPTPVPTEDAASAESDDPLADSATGPTDPDALAPLDGWLAELYAGKHRPEWMTQLVAPLSEMLDAESGAERHAAALALLPFGNSDRPLIVLRTAAEQDPRVRDASAHALKWLTREDRSALFWELIDSARDDSARAVLVAGLGAVQDPRDQEVYWKLLEREDMSRDLAQAVKYALERALFGERYYDLSSLTSRRRRAALAAIEPHLGSGSARKRVVALILLAPLAEERAAEEVLQLINDPDLSPDAQREAFQLRLLIATGSDRTRQAIEALADPDPQRQAIALRLLALGPRALNPLLDSGLDVPNSLLSDESSMSDSGRDRHQVIVPQAPRSLEAEHVRPLIRATDPESAAYAGYLLALFGHEEGLESLLSYWRTQQGNDRLDRLVYRAIAALDDSQYIPLLREIRARLEDESSINEFYWTIRAMSGPEILQFRRQLRREAGMIDPQ